MNLIVTHGAAQRHNRYDIERTIELTVRATEAAALNSLRGGAAISSSRRGGSRHDGHVRSHEHLWRSCDRREQGRGAGYFQRRTTRIDSRFATPDIGIDPTAARRTFQRRAELDQLIAAASPRKAWWRCAMCPFYMMKIYAA
jgi:hypothetical protein